MREFILSAAIIIRDGIEHAEQPKNIKLGFVITGRRHNNCYKTLEILLGLSNINMSKFLKDNDHSGIDHGFITSTNRYVGRIEAFKIAQTNNQLRMPELHDPNTVNNILTSEDLY